MKIRRRVPALLSLVALALAAGLGTSLAACGDDELLVPAPRPALAELSSEGARLVVDAAGSSSLWLGQRELLRLPPDAWVLGTVGALDPDKAYDPWTALGEDPLGLPPLDLAWRTPRAVEVSDATVSHAELSLDYGDGLTATVLLDVGGPRRFSVAWSFAGGEVAYQRLAARVDPKEGFYGLGEQLDAVNQRGKRRAMQLEIDGRTESKNNEAHVPIPLLHGTTGWGMFVQSQLVGAFDVASVEDDLVEAIFRAEAGSPLDVVLFAEEHPLDLVGHYWDLTGAPKPPAPWALGPLLWRDENVDQAEVLGDLEALRDLDLAATGFWIDRPYATAVNTFDFDAPRFPDPAGMIARAHALGLRAALWHVPYLDEEADATASLRAEAEEGGYYPPQLGVLLNGWGKPLDFTNPEATRWWQQQLGAYQRLGIEGYKLDYAEDVVPSLADARSMWRFADGSDERTMHARYAGLYHATYRAMLPDDGGFLLCRHANPGGQALGIVVWPGDLDASFARFAEQQGSAAESYASVGGLPASVIAGASLSASGFPFFGADTGGYRHAPPDAELLVRWMEQTAFSVVMQVGNGASTVPWDPDLVTAEGVRAVDVFRLYGREHLRLFPYLWSLAQRLPSDRRPLVRPLGLAYPELGEHPDDVYLLGPDVLVAPVVDRDARGREVLFPPGTWVDWWTGERIEGPGRRAVAAGIDVLPVYLRAGGFVPRLRTTIDTLSPTTEPERVDSFATRAGPLWWRAVAGEAAAGEVWEGSRVAMVIAADGAAEIDVTPGAVFAEDVILELLSFGPAPAQIDVDGAAVGAGDAGTFEAASTEAAWAFAEEAGGRLLVRVPTGAHHVVIRR